MTNEELSEQYAEFIADRLEIDCLVERATEAIYQDVIKSLNDGSITARELLNDMENLRQ
jgi:hypothetical protein